MSRKQMGMLLLVALAALFVCAASALGDDIKARMTARLPVINDLKAQGLIGENNQGYLEFRGGQKPQADVINAENEDRRSVYTAIATRQNATPEFVGQTRAAQITGKEPAGNWIQDANGTWLKK